MTSELLYGIEEHAIITFLILPSCVPLSLAAIIPSSPLKEKTGWKMLESKSAAEQRPLKAFYDHLVVKHPHSVLTPDAKNIFPLKICR